MHSVVIEFINQPLLYIELDKDSSAVIVSGEKVMVHKVKEIIQDACESTMEIEELVSINDKKFFAYLRFKLDKLLEIISNVKVAVDDKVPHISIAGKKANRDAFKQELKSLEKSMCCVPVKITSDLVHFLSTAKGRTLLQGYLKGSESLVMGYFESPGTLVLLSSAKVHSNDVAKNIQKNFCSLSVSFPKYFFSSLSSTE